MRGTVRWLVAATALAVVAVVAAGLVLDQPLRAGSVGGPDTSTTTTQHDGETTVYVGRYAPGGDYFTIATVRNDGLVPITLIGPDRSDVAAMEPGNHALIWPEDFRTYQLDETSDPRTSAELPATSIAPGDELSFWIHWKMGSACHDDGPAFEPGSSIATERVPVTWSLFGIPKSANVDLRYRFAVANPLDNPVTSCHSA